MKRRGYPWIFASILTRAGVLGMLVLGALWPTYLNLLYAYNNPRLVALARGEYWAAFYRGVHGLDAVVGQERLLSSLFFGTSASVTFLGIPFVDPLVFISLVLDNPSVAQKLALSAVAIGIAVLVFGRGFCSFACPASLFFGFTRRLRERLEWLLPGLAQLRWALPDGLRYGMLLGGTLAAALSGAWVWSLILPYSMVSTELVNLVIGAPLGITFTLFVFVLLADALIFPGEVCRALCPLGLLLGRASRHAVIRVRSESHACLDDCQSCLVSCDLALDPREGAVADCNLCGRCVVACPAKKISIRPMMPRFWTRAATATAVLSFLVLFPSSAEAHHYHGLPHYGYFDNYPQTPTEEYIAGEGRWEMNFTLYNFQGMQREDVNQPDDVQIFLVIFDLKEKGTYGGRAEITIRSGDEVQAKWNQVAEQESIFLINTRMDQTEDLTLHVRFTDPDGKTVVLSSPFHLPGEGERSPLLWIGCGLILLVLTMVFASKQKRPTRSRTNAGAK